MVVEMKSASAPTPRSKGAGTGTRQALTPIMSATSCIIPSTVVVSADEQKNDSPTAWGIAACSSNWRTTSSTSTNAVLGPEQVQHQALLH